MSPDQSAPDDWSNRDVPDYLFERDDFNARAEALAAERQRNADTIADLTAALRELETEVTSLDRPRLVAIADRARAALAKAEGGTK